MNGGGLLKPVLELLCGLSTISVDPFYGLLQEYNPHEIFLVKKESNNVGQDTDGSTSFLTM